MEFPEDHSANQDPVQDSAQDIAQGILDSLRRIVRALRISSRLYEKNHGLSVTQLFVLEQLLRNERPLSMNELARATLTHQSSVSVVVSRLVERGLVHRAPSAQDARRVEASLSPAGRKVLDSALASGAGQIVQDRIVSAIGELGQERGQRLASLLRELVGLAGFDATEPGMFEE